MDLFLIKIPDSATGNALCISYSKTASIPLGTVVTCQCALMLTAVVGKVPYRSGKSEVDMANGEIWLND